MTTQQDPQFLASDPSTDPGVLHQLAANHPELRALIAANPATYPALLEWLGTLGDPAVDMALAARNRVPTAPTPDAGLPVTPFAPSTSTPAVSSLSAASAATAGSLGPATLAPGATQLMTPLAPRTAPALPLEGMARPAEDSRQRTIIIIAAAVALALALSLITWFVLHGRSQAEQVQAAHASQPAAVVTASPRAVPTLEPSEEATPTPTPTPTAEVISAPAPANAIVMDSFSAPSGNIVCTLGEDTLNCTINEYYFTPASDTCSGGQPFTASVTAQGSVSGNCELGFSAAGSPVLPYGSAARNDTFACTSNQNGIECWSQITGDGVFLAREGADPIKR